MKKRETELDILRLLAMVAVIFTHASGIAEESAAGEKLLIFLAATVTWHVPVFVLISGRFFLDPERNISVDKLCKAITRLVAAFAFWNVIYQIYYVMTGTYIGLNWKGILSQALIGPYHFWYLFMLVCLYAITPFLRKIAEDKNLTEYFIALFLAFGFLTTYGSSLPLMGATVSEIVAKTNFHFALGYSGYYILGYYLSRYPLTGKKEIGLYVLGITMLFFTGFATVWKTLQGAEGREWFSKYLMPNIIIEAAAIYTFFVNRLSKIRFSSQVDKIISKLSEYSFGAYLVHALILELLSDFGVGEMPAHPMIVITLALALDFVISIAVTALLRKIPYIGKKIT